MQFKLKIGGVIKTYSITSRLTSDTIYEVLVTYDGSTVTVNKNGTVIQTENTTGIVNDAGTYFAIGNAYAIPIYKFYEGNTCRLNVVSNLSNFHCTFQSGDGLIFHDQSGSGNDFTVTT